MEEKLKSLQALSMKFYWLPNLTEKFRYLNWTLALNLRLK
jgi:hypothetical protein